jgi:T-complex protein 1 subunit beta
LEAIQIIKKLGGQLQDAYLDEVCCASAKLSPRHNPDLHCAQGFILDKKIGVNQPKRIENARILIANTSMDTDKIKVYGARVRVDSTAKVAEIEAAERKKMKDKVDRILAHDINVFINRQLIYNYPEQVWLGLWIRLVSNV